MRPLVLQMGVTVDGYVAGTGAEGDWGLPAEHPEVKAWKVASLDRVGTHVMGRVTYKELASYWPHQSGEYAAFMNNLPKVVFSSTLSEATWPDSRVAQGDLRAEVGRSRPNRAVRSWSMAVRRSCRPWPMSQARPPQISPARRPGAAGPGHRQPRPSSGSSSTCSAGSRPDASAWPRRGSAEQFSEQVVDQAGDGVAERADRLQGEASRIGEIPVEVTPAGEDGTGVAAAHRDDDVGGVDLAAEQDELFDGTRSAALCPRSGARSRAASGFWGRATVEPVTRSTELVRLLRAITAGDRVLAGSMLEAEPSLVTALLERQDEFFAEPCRAHFYGGDTALHAAAFAYDWQLARDLLARGADVRARNRRGAEPLHAAVNGEPGAAHWDPGRQRAVIDYLISAGADPDSAALGGVTPLHRAVRNRCSAAVEALLAAGADPQLASERGSTPADLARAATGRGGTGSPAAKTEQRIIIDLLSPVR